MDATVDAGNVRGADLPEPGTQFLEVLNILMAELEDFANAALGLPGLADPSGKFDGISLE